MNIKYTNSTFKKMFEKAINKNSADPLSSLYISQNRKLKKQEDTELNKAMLESIYVRKTSFKIDGTSLK